MSCAVCLDSTITEVGNGSYIARCGHCLHLKCWEECLRNSPNPTCPVCRKAATKQQLIRVYFNGDGDGDITTPFSRKIDSLRAQIQSLNAENHTSAEQVSSQQNMNASLRAELKKNDGKLADAVRELKHLRDQLKKGELEKDQLVLYRRRFQDQLDSARSSGNNKREGLRKLLALIQEEVEKFHSEIQTLKSGRDPAHPATNSKSKTNIHALEIKLNKLKEHTTNLNKRLQLASLAVQKAD